MLQLSNAEARELGITVDGRIRKETKYHNKKTEIDGIVFDSKREAARWVELKHMQRAGMIKDLQRQVRFELIPKQPGENPVYYVADFVFKDMNGHTIVEDAKGSRTNVYVIKRKLMLLVHGIRIKEV